MIAASTFNWASWSVGFASGCFLMMVAMMIGRRWP